MSIHSLLFQWLFLKGQFGKLALTYHIQIINSKNPKNKQKSASFGMTFMIRAHLGIQEHFHQDLEEPRSSLLNSQDAWATTHFFILLRISVLVLQTAEQLFLWFFPPSRHLALICNFVKLKHKNKAACFFFKMKSEMQKNHKSAKTHVLYKWKLVLSYIGVTGNSGEGIKKITPQLIGRMFWCWLGRKMD